ncbi:integral membrane protein [Trichoderma arundinaceum]|uniref:Integral membrane protein n=1 Tax=Trichoderma arundinaceum TaxID=490622 RepID=A0A395P1E1_TRIAR|nr:integral membrane protein [Trichoderma arundinaceum]
MDRDFMEQLWSQRHYGTPLAVIFMVLPTIAVGLRLYAKITARQPIELSDYFSIAAWANTAGFFISLLVAVYLPASFLDNPDGIDVPVSKITFSLNLLWAGACYCCKLSILCLYYRLLSTPSSTFRLVVQGMFILTACIGIASCLGFLLIFRDLSWWWTTGLRSQPQALAQEIKMNEAIDILSLLTDTILFIMPLPVIRKLSLDKNKKRLLIALFSLGFLTCIEVVVRIITTYGFSGALDAIQVQSILMGIEPAMGITLCSLPVFLRLFRKGDHGSSGRNYASGERGNFYSLGPMSAKRSTRDPDGALLDSTLGKPKPVLVQTEITIHSSRSEYNDSLESQEGYWK